MARPLNVLLVEDSPNDAEMVLRQLRRAGFEPDWTRVDSEAEYLTRLQTGIEIVISDYEMPQFNGMRALDLRNQSGLDVPFILVSGTIGEDTAVEAMKQGANDYLIKDRLSRLGSAVEHALDECLLRAEKRRAAAALIESERFNEATLDSLTAHIAILDEHGTILAVNRSWRDFAAENGLVGERAAIGANYLRVCEQATGPTGAEARQVGNSIRAVLEGQSMGNEVEYPCHSPTERRWFVARVTAFPGDGLRRAVVAHENITLRKRAEAAVVASEQHYRLLFESNPEPMWAFDLETLRFLAVNAAAVNHYGFTREEFLEMTIKDIRPPEDVPDLEEAHLQKSGAGRSSPARWRHRKKDGTLIEVEITANGLLFSGRPTRLVLANDVTERNRAEMDLRWKTAFLEAQVTSSLDGILVVDPQGKKVLQNQRMIDLLKIPPDIANDRDDAPQLRWTMAQTKEPEKILERVVYLTTHRDEVSRDEIELKDGTVLDRYSAPVVGKAGDYFGRIWTFRDMTEERTSRRVLRESEERFRGLIENASDLIAVVDVEGRIEFQSPSAQRLLGYSPEEVLGKRLTDFIHPDDVGIASKGFARALSNAPPTPVEYRIRHSDGRWRVFQSSGQLMPEHGGRKLIVVNSRDVTETRELESQFLRAQRLEAIGTLSSGIAHDLNNILSPILMVARLLKGNASDARDLEMLGMIEQAAQRGASIIRQLLTFSRGIEGHRGLVQVRHIVREMISIMKETFPREIAVGERLAPNLWPVTADATQIHQVLMNLCVNARDVMRRGGLLTITAENVVVSADDAAPHTGAGPGPHVRVTVADTGEGIPRASLDRIFEPFYTTKEMGKGTGLGLSTVLGIVKSHGGFVTVDSEPGRGSEFKIHLPAAADSVAEAGGAVPSHSRGKGETILVVDDELAIRHSTCLILENNNYRVLVAANALEALKLYLEKREGIRLVLTDIMMPGTNGVALARALREMTPQLRIIATSGLQDQERRDELAVLGVTMLLAKPSTPEEILSAVSAALAT